MSTTFTGYIIPSSSSSCTTNNSLLIISKSIKLCKPTTIRGAKRLDYSSIRRRPVVVSWPNLLTPSRQKQLMAGLTANACDAEDGFQPLEQESFIAAPSDFILSGGFESTLNTLSKWIGVLLFGGIILLRHDAESLWAAMGAILNAVLSITLKKILNQERPVSALRSGPGMPSSHAQSMFYIVTFIIISLVQWNGINGLTSTLSGLFFIIGSYFSWLRVSQQFHTTSQIVVGAIMGSIFSILWFWSWNTFVLSLFVSYLWIRMLVVLGAIGFCVCFLYYIYKSWIMKEW